MLVTGCWYLMIFQTAVNWHWRVLKNNWRGCSVRARRCSRYGDLEAPFAECAEKGEPVSCVLHFAALKAVGESVSHPLRYYDVNVAGTLNLLAAMHAAEYENGVQFLGNGLSSGFRFAYTEQHAIGPSNPYGQTKAMVEQILRDHCEANRDFTGIALRYFNPIGAHGSGQIGDQPLGIPNNLFPYITRAAIGSLPVLPVLGRIIQPSMAAVCATTSTFRTWPLGTSRRLTGLLKTMFAVFIPSIWVPAEARRCCS